MILKIMTKPFKKEIKKKVLPSNPKTTFTKQMKAHSFNRPSGIEEVSSQIDKNSWLLQQLQTSKYNAITFKIKLQWTNYHLEQMWKFILNITGIV